MYSQLAFLTSLLLTKVTATKCQYGGYVTQPVQTILTSPVQCQPAGLGSFTPVAQFVIPAIIKPMLQPEPTVQNTTPAVPGNTGVPGYGCFPNSVPYGYPSPFGGMPPIIIESDDDDDDFTSLLYILVLALGNRRCGFGGYGNCCGGCGGARCGGACSYGCCDGYQNCIPYPIPFPNINPYGSAGGATIADIAGLLGYGAGIKALGGAAGIGAGGGAYGYGAKGSGNRGSCPNDEDCTEEINLIIR